MMCIKSQKGFTLIEVLVVISIISTLFVLVVPQINSSALKSNEAGLRTDFKSFQLSSESFFRETLGKQLAPEELNPFLDTAHQVVEEEGGLRTKSSDPWGNGYKVAFGSRKVSFLSYGEKGDASSSYGMVTYIDEGVVDSCTYGFATGNVPLSKIKPVPSDFLCGGDLSTELPVVPDELDTPASFRVLYVEETMAALAWEETEGATSYTLKRNGVTIYSGASTTYSDITLARGVTYTYTLTAKEGTRTSSHAEITVTTTNAPPALRGSGTVTDPYIIFSPQQLQNISKKGNAHYALGTNIAAGATKQWNNGKGFIPIPFFSGSLDGRGFSIVDLTIRHNASAAGIFGNVTSASVIKNVSVVDADVSGVDDVGIVAGNASGKITNVHVSGVVTGTGEMVGGITGNSVHLNDVSAKAVVNGNDAVGGITGYHSGGTPLANASFEGKVEGSDTVGGIAGHSSSGIERVRVIATVNGGSQVGGIAGSSARHIQDAFADVTLTATGDNAGGIVGSSYNYDATISRVTAQGTVKGADFVGGVVGYNEMNMSRATSSATVVGTNKVGGLVGNNAKRAIKQSHATGNVTGTTFVGGLIGYEYNLQPTYTHTDVYATGRVTGDDSVGGLMGSMNSANLASAYATGRVIGNKETGGLIGVSSSSSVTNSFYDRDTSGQSDTGKGVGKTTVEMKNQLTYTAWDFSSTWELNARTNNGYPTLRISQ